MKRMLAAVACLLVAAGVPVRAQGPVSPDSIPRPRGFWMAVGAGVGGLGCDCRTDGGGREVGLVTTLALGGVVNDRLVSGGEGTYWVRSYDGHTLTYLAFDAFVLFYPQPPYGFFLKGGAGFRGFWTDLEHFRGTDRLGVGLSIGLGYDIPLGSALAVTPYLSASRANLRDTAARVVAAGMRLTLY